MKKYQLNFPPAVETQTILETGRGWALQITLSHSLEAAQTTTFYDREGVQLAQYIIHPSRCPYTITFRNRDAFSFENGLKVNTGGCVLNILLVY
jgi:hypothetical protein